MLLCRAAAFNLLRNIALLQVDVGGLKSGVQYFYKCAFCMWLAVTHCSSAPGFLRSVPMQLFRSQW